MSAIAPPRVDWVARQLLGGGDLRAAEAFLDARRARHVRAAHRTWGVAVGLTVEISGTPPAVIVGPGLAYDACGRELLVERATIVPGSRTALAGKQPFTVALRSAGERCVPDAQLRVAGGRAPLAPGRDVSLGTVDPATGAVETAGRPHVATLAPAHVASGLVGVGGVPAARTGGRLRAVVDTARAGFATTPWYVVEAVLGPAAVPAGLQVLLAVTAASPTSFTIDVRRTATAAATLQQLSVPSVGGLPFGLAWIGVEPQPAAGVLAAEDPPCPCLV